MAYAIDKLQHPSPGCNVEPSTSRLSFPSYKLAYFLGNRARGIENAEFTTVSTKETKVIS